MKNPVEPIEDATPKPKEAKATTPVKAKVTPYIWPGETPEGSGPFNKVTPQQEEAAHRRARNRGWMDAAEIRPGQMPLAVVA